MNYSMREMRIISTSEWKQTYTARLVTCICYVCYGRNEATAFQIKNVAGAQIELRCLWHDI